LFEVQIFRDFIAGFIFILDVQVFKLRKTVGKRVRESVLQFDVFQQYVDEPACAVYKNFCH
jgi:hypothetical protein